MKNKAQLSILSYWARHLWVNLLVQGCHLSDICSDIKRGDGEQIVLCSAHDTDAFQISDRTSPVSDPLSHSHISHTNQRHWFVWQSMSSISLHAGVQRCFHSASFCLQVKALLPAELNLISYIALTSSSSSLLLFFPPESSWVFSHTPRSVIFLPHIDPYLYSDNISRR